MFITLIGTIAAGFLGAGCVLLLRFLMKERVPSWALPVAAGGFMLAATISSEYGWFPNTSAALPEGIEIVAMREHQAPWQPWTYLVPYVNSFVALDRSTVQENAEAPDLKLVDLYLYTRWRAVTQMQMAVDCDAFARADLIDGTEMDESGRPTGVTWREVPADDELVLAACG